MGDPRLLDWLPIIETDLGRLPEQVERELFDGFQLQVRYHQPTRWVTLRVTIDGKAIPRLTTASQAIMQRTGAAVPRNTERPPTARAAGGPRSFSLAGRAPGANSICDTAPTAWSVDRQWLTVPGRGTTPPPPYGGGDSWVRLAPRPCCWVLLGNSSVGTSANRASVKHLVSASTASRAWGPPALDCPQWPRRAAAPRPERSRSSRTIAATGSQRPRRSPAVADEPTPPRNDPGRPTRRGGDGPRRRAAGHHGDRHHDRHLVARPPARPCRVNNGPGVANLGRARSASSRAHSRIGGTR
jgi:hypothetical protein